MRKSHKLLAVVMWLGSTQAQADTPRLLDNGGPAAGNTVGKIPERPRGSAEGRLAEAQGILERAAREKAEAVQAFVSTPRVLASGAPACGNTMQKKEPDCTQELADKQQAVRFERLQRAVEQHRIADVRVQQATRTVVASLPGGDLAELMATR